MSWTNFCFNLHIYPPSLVIVEHSVGSNTNNMWTAPLAVHSWHLAAKRLWWWGGWVHWIVFMMLLCIYNFMTPFFMMGCICLKAIQSQYEDTVYFLPEIPGTHQINLGRIKGWYEHEAIQWFWTSGSTLLLMNIN